jgi:hypothetical protein
MKFKEKTIPLLLANKTDVVALTKLEHRRKKQPAFGLPDRYKTFYRASCNIGAPEIRTSNFYTKLCCCQVSVAAQLVEFNQTKSKALSRSLYCG